MPTITANPPQITLPNGLEVNPSSRLRNRLPTRWRQFDRSEPEKQREDSVQTYTKTSNSVKMPSTCALLGALTRIHRSATRHSEQRNSSIPAESLIAVPLVSTIPVENLSRTSPHESTERLPGKLLTERERRAFPRRESGCLVSVCPVLPHESLATQQIAWQLHAGRLTGRLADVSMNGIALELPRELEANTRLHLRISNRQQLQHLDISGSVLRSTSHEPGVWNIVCRLDRKLTFEQIHAIGKHLLASTIV